MRNRQRTLIERLEAAIHSSERVTGDPEVTPKTGVMSGLATI
jgi:hypothetical protein